MHFSKSVYGPVVVFARVVTGEICGGDICDGFFVNADMLYVESQEIA
jgi:hypothetical protein